MHPGSGMVYILFIAIYIVSPTYEYENGNWRNDDTRDGLDEERTRRSLARSAVDKILQHARLVTPHLRTRVYEKSGGMTEALNDFNSFNPTRVSTMGNVKVGISGKKAVILNLEEVRPFIEVRYYRQDELGGGSLIRTDIIKYTDKDR